MHFSKGYWENNRTLRQVRKRSRLDIRNANFNYRVADSWTGLDGRIVNCNTATVLLKHISEKKRKFGRENLDKSFLGDHL